MKKKPPPKTNAEYQAEYKQRQRDRGLVRFQTDLWVHPDDIETVKATIRQLTAMRE